MKKKLISFFVAASIVTATLFTACGSATTGSDEAAVTEEASDAASDAADTTAEDTEETTPAPDTDIAVAALKGPTAMGMVKLMDDSDNDATASNHYTFTIAGAADEITPSLIQGEVDIACVPANLAAVLSKKTEGGIQVLAINTLGVLYIVENGDTISEVSDLKGKTIYASGKGATPEYALNFMLTANGLDPEKDVTIEYKSEHSECVSALAADPDGVAMLPQPFVTTAQMSNENTRIALDMTDEWKKAAELEGSTATLVTGVVVARTDFINDNPEAVALFMDQYKESVAYTNENVSDAAALIEKYDIIKAAVAEKAIPYCNITYIAGDEMKEKLGGYLTELYNQNPESVGGEIPGDSFYYTAQ